MCVYVCCYYYLLLLFVIIIICYLLLKNRFKKLQFYLLKDVTREIVFILRVLLRTDPQYMKQNGVKINPVAGSVYLYLVFL